MSAFGARVSRLRAVSLRAVLLRVAALCVAVLCSTAAWAVGVHRASPARAALGGGTDGAESIWAAVSVFSGQWVPGSFPCAWSPYAGGSSIDTIPPDGPPERTVNGVLHRLFIRVCPDAAVRAVWVPVVPPTFLATAATNVLSRMVPRPAVHLAPPADRGVVHVGMWFWTNPMQWVPVSVTAAVPTTTGVLWVTTTATPTALIWWPGESRAVDDPRAGLPVVCAGPGLRWLAAFGDRWPSPTGCTYTYRHSSVRAPAGRAFSARLSIRWRVTWRSSTGAMGSGGQLLSSTASEVVVREIEALGVGEG